RLSDTGANVVDDTAEIAAGDIAGDHDAPLHVLPQDHVRPFLAPDIGKQPDRHLSTGWRIDRKVGDSFEFDALRRVELHRQIKRGSTIEDASDRRTCECRLHSRSDVVHVQAVAGDRRSIQDESNERHVHLLLERKVDDAGYAADGLADVLTETAER